MSRITVYEKKETPGVSLPSHSASKSLALLVLALPAARWTDEKKTAIQLLTTETFKQVKQRARRTLSSEFSQLLPPSPPMSMMLAYPPAAYGPDERRRQRELWMGATRF